MRTEGRDAWRVSSAHASLSDVSISVVKLPSVWKHLGAELWSVDAALGSAKGFRDVARRTTALTGADSGSEGVRTEFTCLSQHGLERRTLYALFLEEIRRRGLFATSSTSEAQESSGSTGANDARQASRRHLHLIPVVPIPASINQSLRALLSLGLQEAVMRSVAVNPPPAGSSGPNHFMIVARVCSCFISGDRRPQLGKRARDECQPFPRAGRTLELSRAVRVVSFEQVTPLDRQWVCATDCSTIR